ncbi:MAG: 3-methyladenine DNA glycosylase AlkD [Psychrosphaera sp.]|jgi:3-methyladenine DNA glycosylase AlkD
MTTSQQILNQLSELADATIAEHSSRFFKSGVGEYGEGDKFWGIRVPALRQIAKQNVATPLDEIVTLLYHDHHETRLLAVFMLVQIYEKNKKSPDIQQQVFDLYLQHSKQFNNWDLVDSSAHKICGPHLYNQKKVNQEIDKQDRSILYTYAKSDNIWQRRIAMMTTYYFIKRDDYQDAFALAKILLNDQHDLIHKIVGWMLREVGNRNLMAEREFLNQHYQDMPRTMLRYAIEKFDKPIRHQYLKGLI